MFERKETSLKTLLELILVMGISVFLFLSVPGLAWVYTVIPLIYLLIERRIRHRSFKSMGMKYSGIIADLRTNFRIIILVAVGIQFAVIVGSYWFWPPLFLRFQERVAYLQAHFGTFAPFFMFLPLVALSTFLEELVFRGFVQERVSWFFNDFVAIIVGALLLTVFHYSSGELPIVMMDLFLVFLDSSLYGLIYLRSRNVFAAWTAHLSADLVGIILLLML